MHCDFWREKISYSCGYTLLTIDSTDFCSLHNLQQVTHNLSDVQYLTSPFIIFFLKKKYDIHYIQHHSCYVHA